MITMSEEPKIHPLIKEKLWKPLKPLKQVTTDKGRWYEDVDDPSKKYYSVTTVIDASKSAAARNAIEAWKKAEIAEGKDPNRYSVEGEHMHSLIEYYYRNAYEYPPLDQCYGRGYQLFKRYDEGFLKTTSVIPLIIEGKIYTEVDGMKYAGTIDLVAEVRTEPESKPEIALIDHKSISKIKNASSKRKGYIPQLAAYAKAIKDQYGITIDCAYLNFASERSFKSYRIEIEEIMEQWDQFYYKLDAFYRKAVFPDEQL